MLRREQIFHAHALHGLPLVRQGDHALRAGVVLHQVALDRLAGVRHFQFADQLQGAREKRAAARLAAQFPLGRASVHPSLRGQPFFLARERLARHADETMAQLDAQRRRHGPQFRHGERLHIVKSQQRAFQPRLGERRAAAFQERASEQGDARQSLHGGQPSAPLRARLLAIGFHAPRVVVEPFHGGRERAAFSAERLRAARERAEQADFPARKIQPRARIHAQAHGQSAHPFFRHGLAARRGPVPFPVFARNDVHNRLPPK